MERAFTVFEHDCDGRQPGVRMGAEGRLRHDEVVDHDQRVHQTAEVRMLVALGRKPLTNGDLAAVALLMCFAGNACELINQVRGHVILSLLLH